MRATAKSPSKVWDLTTNPTLTRSDLPIHNDMLTQTFGKNSPRNLKVLRDLSKKKLT